MNMTSLPTDPKQPMETPSKRDRPIITEGEDRPFDEQEEENGDSYQIKTIEEKEQEHKHKVEDYKNTMGGIILVACFLLILVFSLLDAFCEQKLDSTLFSSAFEFAKTIATAVIGYLFATNVKKNE